MKTKLECISVVFSFKLFWENIHWDTSSACSACSVLWHQHLESLRDGQVLHSASSEHNEGHLQCFSLAPCAAMTVKRNVTSCFSSQQAAAQGLLSPFPLHPDFFLQIGGHHPTESCTCSFVWDNLSHCQWRSLPGSASHEPITQPLKLAQHPGEGSWLLHQVLEEFDGPSCSDNGNKTMCSGTLSYPKRKRLRCFFPGSSRGVLERSSSHKSNPSCNRWQITTVFKDWEEKPVFTRRWVQVQRQLRQKLGCWAFLAMCLSSFLATPWCWCSWLQPIQCSRKCPSNHAAPQASSWWTRCYRIYFCLPETRSSYGKVPK